MKPFKATLLLVCLLTAASIAANAQLKYSKVKIPVDMGNQTRQQEFVYGKLQIDHCHFEDNSFILEIGPAELALLKASGYRHEILIDDIAKNLQEVNATQNFYQSDIAAQTNRTLFQVSCRTVGSIIPTPAQFTPGGMGGYYTYAEMVTKIGWLYDNYPTLVDTFSIGVTGEGRNIWCVKISDNVSLDELTEPEVSVNALQHAREAIAGTSVIFFMQYLCENYATDPKVRQLVDSRQIYLIPCTNPDGYVYNQTTNPGGGGGWRKNRRPLPPPAAPGQFGVDLNRNYNANWGDCTTLPIGGIIASCGNGTASSANETYWGTGPFSEPETRAMRDFTASRRFRMSIDQHSEGAWNTTPHGRIGLHPGGPTGVDRDFLYGFSSSTMATYNCHRIGNNLETLNYEVAGGNKDWMFQGDTSMTVNPRKIYAFTSEAGGGSFWPSIGQIIPLAKGLCFQYLQAALAAGSYADIQDMNDAAIPAAPLTGNMNYLVRRVGILDAPIIVSLIPLQNIATVGSPDTINSIAAYNGTVTGNIPYSLYSTISAGQVVRFLWRVSTGGIVTTDTITKIYNPTSMFYEDMETAGNFATNWATSGGWGYSTTQAYAGSRSISESPVGNYPVNTTRTLTTQATFDLSNATAAYLSFWVRHRSENCYDNLRIQVSRNATTVTNGTYFNLCGQHTISEPDGTLGSQPALTGIRENWTREVINLSQYIGAGNASVRLRFSFSSNDDTGDPYDFRLDDGFYIDNLRLMKTTSTLVILPVNFLKFEGKLIGNGRAELFWQAETDAMHDYFEIERSNDRNTFVSLGRTVTTPPYKFIDPSVQVGNNYYRVKQVDKDGRITYSNIINIFYKPGQVNMVVYPNPVTDFLKIRMTSTTPEQYTVQISDLAGRTIHKEKVIVGSTARELNINFKAQASQVYVLTIRNSDNEVINTQKIIKQ